MMKFPAVHEEVELEPGLGFQVDGRFCEMDVTQHGPFEVDPGRVASELVSWILGVASRRPGVWSSFSM